MFKNLNQRYTHRHLVPNNVKQATKSSRVLSQFLATLQDVGRVNVLRREESEEPRLERLFTDSRNSRPKLLFSKSAVIRSRQLVPKMEAVRSDLQGEPKGS